MHDKYLLVYNLPEFDTGQYEDSEFTMSCGNAVLTIHIDELPTIRIQFDRVRWHLFTALTNCKVEMIESSYFRLVEVKQSEALSVFIQSDYRNLYEKLHHYRIFLDETGCHEIFSKSVSINPSELIAD
jgi:hypothetical protein